MGKTTKVLWRILFVILLPILFIITLVIISLPILCFFERTCKREVTGDIPRGFPILVITPADANNNWDAHILYKEGLNDFLSNNQQYTLLVPDGQSKRLNQMIFQKCRVRTWDYNGLSPAPWFARFKTKQIAGNRQLLEVEGTSGDDIKNVGWYETDGKEIFPKFYKNYFGPGLAMVALLWAFVANVVMWGIGLGFYAYAYYKKRRLAMASAC